MFLFCVRRKYQSKSQSVYHSAFLHCLPVLFPRMLRRMLPMRKLLKLQNGPAVMTLSRLYRMDITPGSEKAVAHFPVVRSRDCLLRGPCWRMRLSSFLMKRPQALTRKMKTFAESDWIPDPRQDYYYDCSPSKNSLQRWPDPCSGSGAYCPAWHSWWTDEAKGTVRWLHWSEKTGT